MICHFDSSSGVSSADAGSEISFTTASAHSGKRWFKVGSEYKKCLSTTFQICKDPKLFTDGDDVITAEEFRQLSRWLNRREFLWFHAYDWCDPEVKRPWVRASMNLERIDVGNETVGVEISVTTDSPFGYGDEVTKILEFKAGELEQTFYDLSDEIGEYYPEMEVKTGAAGTFTLANEMTGCSCEVENCASGETLYFSGESMIIETDSDTHAKTLANDFNYDYFSIGNKQDDRANVITAGAPCTVTLKYRPILKDTM
jgi:hypothetical protein